MTVLREKIFYCLFSCCFILFFACDRVKNKTIRKHEISDQKKDTIALKDSSLGNTVYFKELIYSINDGVLDSEENIELKITEDHTKEWDIIRKHELRFCNKKINAEKLFFEPNEDDLFPNFSYQSGYKLTLKNRKYYCISFINDDIRSATPYEILLLFEKITCDSIRCIPIGIVSYSAPYCFGDFDRNGQLDVLFINYFEDPYNNRNMYKLRMKTIESDGQLKETPYFLAIHYYRRIARIVVNESNWPYFVR